MVPRPLSADVCDRGTPKVAMERFPTPLAMSWIHPCQPVASASPWLARRGVVEEEVASLLGNQQS